MTDAPSEPPGPVEPSPVVDETPAAPLTVVRHPLVQHKLTLMREADTSTASFRRLLREISHLLAYEITRELPLTLRRITTPLTEMDAPMIEGKKLALISILRAGNGLLDGILELIPAARVGFVGLYRDPVSLEPVQYYVKVPSQLEERVTIVVDPMLATGNSSVAAVDILKKEGARDIRFMCLLAAPEGIHRMRTAHPDVAIVTAAIDSHLDDHGYIVPGLGDAGDRMFGTK
jgi:uracil phosphoribosyltransferase